MTNRPKSLQEHAVQNRNRKPAGSLTAPLGAEGQTGRRGRIGGFIAPNRKLSDEDVADIRYRVGSGRISQRKAALEYDVSQKTVFGIMAGTLYVRTKSGGTPAKQTRASHFTPPRRPVPRFELVTVQPIQEAQCGRSYGLFPLKRRTA